MQLQSEALAPLVHFEPQLSPQSHALLHIAVITAIQKSNNAKYNTQLYKNAYAAV